MTQALALPIPSSVGNIDAYIQAANRYPLLSEAEETQLAERFHNEGDVEAALTVRKRSGAENAN